MIKGLIFDFDGLILDTEGPDYQAWQDVFGEYGKALPIEVWSDCIGRPADFFDPIEYLQQMIAVPLEKDELKRKHRGRHDELMAESTTLPGIEGYLTSAERHGLRLAIASSSSSGWVVGHLERLGISTCWTCMACREDVENGKPAPDLYRLALERLALEPDEVIAFEDSPNGVAAAKAAGIFCVAVPNPLTARLDLSAADLRLESLQDEGLEALIALSQHTQAVSPEAT